MGSITVLKFLLKLDVTQVVSLLPKSVITAIGMDAAAALGGLPLLAGAVIILTGITGNLTAQWLCNALKITDPLAKGIGIGTSKALEMRRVEGAMSSLVVALADVITAFEKLFFCADMNAFLDKLVDVGLCIAQANTLIELYLGFDEKLGKPLTSAFGTFMVIAPRY